MSDTSATPHPPYYVLVSHGPVWGNSVPPPPTSFTHPAIEYHYADDSPLSLLPQSQGELVLVLEDSPLGGSGPTAKGLTTELAVTGLKITEAPGVGVADDGVPRNNNMYILETTVFPEETLDEEEHQTPQAILARFKQRNTVIRRVLDYSPRHQAIPQEQTPRRLLPSSTVPPNNS